MSDPIRLVAGLGNPGPRYQHTRHNAGFLVLDALARRYNLTFRSHKDAEEARWDSVWLCKPQTYMNDSGRAVQASVTRHSVAPQQLLVVHDDLDMPLGRLRFKRGGGAGGQKGVADTANRIGADFVRLKVGIGRPPERWTVSNWVLSRFQDNEQALLDEVVGVAADAVELIVAAGLQDAMNRYNSTDLRPEAKAAQQAKQDAKAASQASSAPSESSGAASSRTEASNAERSAEQGVSEPTPSDSLSDE
ncbi:MAG: aminoacyl-tRNA hydrolase [Trueperaceae bacterium]|nr:aminoacyl-tRNA hydrolase [Trueperaceae bacterium]